MNDRQWLYAQLTAKAELEAIVGDRIFQGESIGPWMTEMPKTPFLVYRFGNTSRDNLVRVARRQYLTIWCHDSAKPGDYQQIDDMTKHTIDALDDVQGPGSLIVCQWLETSADFDDREMGTITRYSRFQLAKSRIT